MRWIWIMDKFVKTLSDRFIINCTEGSLYIFYCFVYNCVDCDCDCDGDSERLPFLWLRSRNQLAI